MANALHGVEPVVSVSAASVLVEAVKLAEDRSGDLVVRLYEAAGARARSTVVPNFEFTAAWRTDLLERTLGQQTWTPQECIELDLRPFEVVTVRISPGGGQDG
ncbi:glycosyl hydrolase-related protein [Cryptosporangium sp. NPDC048952]|uniref:glycosyl hydrolase-related protein n=1 Tax=Cryptosporangium sp. NPDC048952 TaxID=3363961 RepID=UPI00371DB798